MDMDSTFGLLAMAITISANVGMSMPWSLAALTHWKRAALSHCYSTNQDLFQNFWRSCNGFASGKDRQPARIWTHKRYLQKTKSGCFCREDQRSTPSGSALTKFSIFFPVKTNSLNSPNVTGFLWHFKAWFLHQPQRTESFPRPLQSSQNSQIRQLWTHVTCLKHQLSVWNLGQCMLKHNSHCQPIYYSPGRPWLTSRNLSSMGPVDATVEDCAKQTEIWCRRRSKTINLQLPSSWLWVWFQVPIPRWLHCQITSNNVKYRNLTNLCSTKG